MTEVFFILCAAVAAVSALIATVAARRCSEQMRQMTSVCSALSSERGRIAAHDAELDQITDTLRKLSGRIGAVRKAQRRNGDPLDDDEPEVDTGRLSWKAQMREKYGLVPKPR